ncbi:MAG: futalosine hydrolase [Desulfobulbaceae bacterium]|nr:MAG: futalosine hydrolase [Desulfobulbaceae bacterium]
MVNTMLMLVTATEFELDPFRELLSRYQEKLCSHICGVGPVEAAATTALALASRSDKPDGIINFGIAGAYHRDPPAESIELLELCLAEKECLGDFGICYGERIEPFETISFAADHIMDLQNTLLAQAQTILSDHGQSFKRGTFVTVNGASSTQQRGQHLQQRFDAICENMEGAALARVCKFLAIPLLEMRVVSNMVEDRDKSRWKIEEAVDRMGVVGTTVINSFLGTI